MIPREAALDDVSPTPLESGLLVVTGASGAGKTTIARALDADARCCPFGDVGVLSAGEMERVHGVGSQPQVRRGMPG